MRTVDNHVFIGNSFTHTVITPMATTDSHSTSWQQLTAVAPDGNN